MSFHGPVDNALYQDTNLSFENSELSPMFSCIYSYMYILLSPKISLND